MDPIARSGAPPSEPSSLDSRSLAFHPEDATPAQAAQQFEALLIGELMKSAQQPALDDSPLSGGSAGGIYRDMFADELAKGIAARGGFGLAAALARRPAAPQAGKP